jgi:hypothetical protein
MRQPGIKRKTVAVGHEEAHPGQVLDKRAERVDGPLADGFEPSTSGSLSQIKTMRPRWHR